MRAIRKGPSNRGPLPGPRPPTAPFSHFAAPIWVTLVVQKYRSVSRRIKIKSVLFKARKFPVVVASTKPKAILVVSLVEFRRNRPSTKTILKKPFGIPRANAKIRPVVILDTISVGRELKKYVSTKSQLKKPFGIATTRVKPKGPRVLSKAALGKKQKERFTKASATFIRKFGKPTVAPLARKLLVQLQAINRKNIEKRIKVKTQLRKAPIFTGVVVVTTRPRKIYVVSLQVKRQRFAGKVKLGKVFGRISRNPRIFPLKTILFVSQRTAIKRRYGPVQTKLGKVVLFFAPPPPVVGTAKYIVAPKYTGQLMTRG